MNAATGMGTRRGTIPDAEILGTGLSMPGQMSSTYQTDPLLRTYTGVIVALVKDLRKVDHLEIDADASLPPSPVVAESTKVT